MFPLRRTSRGRLSDSVELPFHPRKVTEADVVHGDVEPRGWYTSKGGKRYIVVYWPHSDIYTVHDENQEPVDAYTAKSEAEAARYITEELDAEAARPYLWNGPLLKKVREALAARRGRT